MANASATCVARSGWRWKCELVGKGREISSLVGSLHSFLGFEGGGVGWSHARIASGRDFLKGIGGWRSKRPAKQGWSGLVGGAERICHVTAVSKFSKADKSQDHLQCFVKNLIILTFAEGRSKRGRWGRKKGEGGRVVEIGGNDRTSRTDAHVGATDLRVGATTGDFEVQPHDVVLLLLKGVPREQTQGIPACLDVKKTKVVLPGKIRRPLSQDCVNVAARRTG